GHAMCPPYDVTWNAGHSTCPLKCETMYRGHVACPLKHETSYAGHVTCPPYGFTSNAEWKTAYSLAVAARRPLVHPPDLPPPDDSFKIRSPSPGIAPTAPLQS